ncbi:MAG: hypothetical protein V3T72_03030 [Thermoanaerobaculia bacterium]
MRRIVVLAMAILIVALLTVPVFAAFRVISDTFDRGSGTGVAIVQVSDTLFVEILYRDLDGSESLTDGDQRLKTQSFSRAVKPAVQVKRG